jgi:hypothetical protein
MGKYLGAALDIEGWMSDEELDWLHSHALNNPVIVEIGSWKGRSTYALADGCPGVLYFVEHFEGSINELHNVEYYGQLFVPDGPTAVRSALLDNLDRFVASGKAFLIEAKSVEAAAFLGPVFMHRPPTMVFIDGDHSREGCSTDILAWRKYFKKPGLLCGHDCDHVGVREAIDEFVPGWQHGAGSIWYKTDFVYGV